MSKALSISFPVKSAAELASHLGVSESRKNRIFTIVEKIVKKNESALVNAESRKKSKRQGTTKVRISRSGQRKNGKASR